MEATVIYSAIKDLRNKGYTYNQIAKELKISKSTIARVLKGTSTNTSTSRPQKKEITIGSGDILFYKRDLKDKLFDFHQAISKYRFIPEELKNQLKEIILNL